MTLLSQSLWRKVVATAIAISAFVLLYDATVIDSKRVANGPLAADNAVPQAGARVDRRFDVGGWAVKDGVGVSKVEVLLDGRVVAEATYGGANEWLRGFLKDASRDPGMPNVQFTARVDAGDLPAGRHWLGLRVTGGDGSVETWAEQPIEIR